MNPPPTTHTSAAVSPGSGSRGAFSPVPIELQVAVLFAMQKNFFDAIDTKKTVAAAASLKDFFTTRKDALLTEIRTKAALDKDLEAKLQAACDEWKPTFAA